jgi:proline racemase
MLTHPEADAGFVIMEQVEYPPMSGTNTICVVTVLMGAQEITLTSSGAALATSQPTPISARGAAPPSWRS